MARSEVWDMEERKTLYKFAGYKAWLGSIWTDGVVSTDGADNTVILHNGHQRQRNSHAGLKEEEPLEPVRRPYHI
jgi:hypothetical protein